MMRRRLWTAVWCLLAVSGCVQTALNPNDKVTVTGTALAEDKSPIASADLSLRRAVTSTCLSPPEFAKLKTDAQGAFSHNLTGADTQKDDVALCFRLVPPSSVRGATATVDFLMQVTKVEVPTVQLWTGSPTATSTGSGAQVVFTDLSASHGLSGLKFTADLTSGGGAVWSISDASSPVVLSAAVLEDFSAVSATLATSNQVKGSGTTFILRYQSDSVDVPLGTLVPVSRGADCTYNKAPTVCPLTDGKLAKNALDAASEVKVTLAAPKALKKVVLRGLSLSGPSNVVLEGSADGTTWTKLVDLTAAAYQEVNLAGAGTVAYARVRGTRTDGGAFNILTLDELSLFE